MTSSTRPARPGSSAQAPPSPPAPSRCWQPSRPPVSSTRESSRLELPARSHTCPTWSRGRLLGRAFEALKPVPVLWDVHAPMSTLRLKEETNSKVLTASGTPSGHYCGTKPFSMMDFRAVGLLDLLRLTGRSVQQTVTAEACVHGSRQSGQRRRI